MPKSTPFGFTEMFIFYDAATKLIAVYFGHDTKAETFIKCEKTKENKRIMLNLYERNLTNEGIQ